MRQQQVSRTDVHRARRARLRRQARTAPPAPLRQAAGGGAAGDGALDDLLERIAVVLADDTAASGTPPTA